MDDATLRSDRPFFALGIDVSKDSLELALLTPEGALRKKNVRNAASGFKALTSWLTRWSGPESPVRACLEASGGYEEAAALFLHEKGLYVSVVNPRQTKSYAESRLQRSKTDPADAALLARYCRREEPPAWQPPTEAERTLRQLTRGLQSLKNERDRTRNRRDRADHDTGDEQQDEAPASGLPRPEYQHTEAADDFEGVVGDTESVIALPDDAAVDLLGKQIVILIGQGIGQDLLTIAAGNLEPADRHPVAAIIVGDCRLDRESGPVADLEHGLRPRWSG